MKFDIVRAWKDETYRQSLSEEQLSALPVNPAGELNETELAAIYGGSVGVGTSSSAAFSEEHRTHSFAVLCDLSIFSLNLITIPIIPIASPTTQACAESH